MASAAIPPIYLADLAATERLAAAVAARARAGDGVLLEGPLGAGKSAFARAFLRAISGDAALEVPSPTFTLVQAYTLPGTLGQGFARGGSLAQGSAPGGSLEQGSALRAGVTAWHFDLYRLRGAADLTELGWDEARAGIVLVEWPDRLGGLRPAGDDTLTIALSPGATPTARWAALAGWRGRALP